MDSEFYSLLNEFGKDVHYSRISFDEIQSRINIIGIFYRHLLLKSVFRCFIQVFFIW
jgi:hypothetical protein